jgi:alcohol dehydrogenase class IV
MARIARLLGEDTAGLSDDIAADASIAAIERLRRDIGIPQRLSDLGVRAEQIPALAEKAFTVKRILRVNPRYPTLDDMVSILHSAL